MLAKHAHEYPVCRESLGEIIDSRKFTFALRRHMEAIISNLLNRFEKGALSRRELIQGLAMLTAAGGTASAATFQNAGLKATKIDHMSIQVTDLPRSIAFYQKIFGLSVVSEDKPNEIVRLGTTKTLVSP